MVDELKDVLGRAETGSVQGSALNARLIQYLSVIAQKIGYQIAL